MGFLVKRKTRKGRPKQVNGGIKFYFHISTKCTLKYKTKQVKEKQLLRDKKGINDVSNNQIVNRQPLDYTRSVT